MSAVVATASPGTGATAEAGAACGAGLQPGRQKLAVRSQGATYHVLVHLPDGFRPGRTLPLVLNLHGATQSGAASLDDNEIDATADRYDFVVVSPDGGIPNAALPVSAPLGYFWNVPGIPMTGGFPTPPRSRDDERFLLDVVATMKRRLCVDRRRTFVEGISNGGMMTSWLACHHADLFAAAGAVAGIRAGRAVPSDPSRIDTAQCRPSRRIPILAIHGREDPRLPYDGNDSTGWGYDVMSAVKRWAVLNGCRGVRRTEISSTATRFTWRRCAADVVLVRSETGGHTWYPKPTPPPYNLVAGPSDASIRNNEILWRFFSNHPLPR